MTGLVHIYTGDGKGKTTAAVGLTVRCAGNGGTVVFCQFLKNNRSSELAILRSVPNIKIVQSDKIFGFYKNLSPEQRAEAAANAEELLKRATAAAISENARLLVLDEIIGAYNHELVNRQTLLDFLQNKPTDLEVVLTGRNPAPELIALADYVSNIQKIKHPFDKGIPARPGIEK
jgi:cob(I)alamin adenosyltransferase